METRVIEKMVDAMHLGAKDVVLLNYWCEAEGESLGQFVGALATRGIAHHAVLYSDEVLTKLIQENPQGLPEDWFSNVADTTVVIDVMEKPAGMPPRGLAREAYPVLGGILQDLFGFMSQHERLIQITMPSECNAMLAGEEFENYEKNMVQALDVDYDALQKACEEKVACLKNNKLKVHTGDDCELVMDITGREWNIDAGEGAFPCGEVYIAPLEDATEGTIFFKDFILEGVGTFHDIIVKVENGKVAESNCKEFNEFLAEQEPGAKVVAELGIGMNPAVRYTGVGAALDEDALGTMHIGLGMNVMFGGSNACRFHMDFVTEGVIEGIDE